MSEDKVPTPADRGPRRPPRGGDRAADAASLIGRRLGRFRVLEVIGEGAMASVMLAEDTALKRRVALKLLPRLADDASRQMWIDQFIREARAAARLVHPHIVQIFEVATAKGFYFIAMEHLRQGTIEQLVQRQGPLPVRRVCELGAQAADALAFAHEAGILHRDIKPANLLLTERGHLKIADFGFAAIADPRDDFKLPFRIIGTPFYMAPEVGRGQHSSQSDIFALGAVLWFALTGRAPFALRAPVDVLRIRDGIDLPDLRALRPDVPDDLVRCLDRALSRRPHDRHDSAAAMCEALREAAEAGPQGAMPEPIPLDEPPEDELGRLSRASLSASAASAVGRSRSGYPTRHRRRRELLRLALGGAALVLLAAGIVLFVLLGEVGGGGNEGDGGADSGIGTLESPPQAAPGGASPKDGGAPHGEGTPTSARGNAAGESDASAAAGP